MMSCVPSHFRFLRRDLSSRVGGVDDLFAKPKAEVKALSVTQLVRRMKNLIEAGIGEIWIEGEVSNLKKQASGHWYFSLKDTGAQIQCAMFGARKRPGCDALEDGAQVRVFAEASVYEARGQLQVIVLKAERAGQGDLQAKFEALKRKLHAEGLFDPARKQPLPAFPKVVGIVTSDTGAAIRDILNILERRAPWVRPVLYPVRVQGKGAEFEIARAIGYLGGSAPDGVPRCDVMIVGRGGGSLEDLWCFNEVVVARAIAACPVPVISAVGHEIDFTIADFVADLRAPTPSAAAELAVPDAEELRARLMGLRRRMVRAGGERVGRLVLRLDSLRRGVLQRGGERLLREPEMHLDKLRMRLASATAGRLRELRGRLDAIRAVHQARHPLVILRQRGERVSAARVLFQKTADEQLERCRRRLDALRGMLRALGPESAFQRGFSITLGPDGKVLRSKDMVRPGEQITTCLADGSLLSRVEKHDD